MRKILRIIWHEIRCPGAWHGAAAVRVSSLGRIYSCGCGFEIYDTFPETR